MYKVGRAAFLLVLKVWFQEREGKKNSCSEMSEGGRSARISSNSNSRVCGLGKRCLTIARHQRTRFYIIRRCISILLCWHDHAIPD
ncbi:hypothetical protein MRB53_012178 [Persea americana]|uniref:Uncharacterized protein n=1 Tax=Persea americana TaxID=3435 RepID=A0ACC2LXV9_PERAE|nr:hypothetical protein MRB53_012178 [Persea americana]